VAENQELAISARSGERPDDTEMIAAVFLFEDFDERAAKHPLIGEEAATAVGRILFEAGRLKESEFSKRVQHIGETRAQKR
jgi:hypothetical protein